MLLAKIYVGEARKKMTYALWWMSKTMRQKGVNVTSYAYEMAKRMYNENHPNKCVERKKKWRENYEAGKYKYDNAKAGKALKATLVSMDTEAMSKRMKNSTANCDHKKRGDAIKKGKGSQYLLTRTDGGSVSFWSYDDVEAIAGYPYDHLRYRLRRHGGLLLNGCRIEVINKFKQKRRTGISTMRWFRVTYPSGDAKEYKNKDDVVAITGYNAKYIEYRLNRYDGLLPNGNTVAGVNHSKKRPNCKAD